jgi:hypothetical protein
MGMNRGKSLIRWIVPALLVSTLISFQNCSGGLKSFTAKSQSNLTVASSGNGGGYEGKVYVARLSDSTCADGSDVSTKIEVREDQKAYILRDNCQTQEPVELPYDSLQLMAHNLDNLIHNSRVFDEEVLASEARTAILCRGDQIDATSGNREVVDAIVREKIVNGTKSYYGQAIFGIYRPDGSLLKVYNLGEVPLSGPYMNGDQESYWSQTALTGEGYNLRLRPLGNDLIGFLEYADDMPPPELHIAPTEVTNHYRVTHLKCYRQ